MSKLSCIGNSKMSNDITTASGFLPTLLCYKSGKNIVKHGRRENK